MLHWFTRLGFNWQLLRRELDRVGHELENWDYGRLKAIDDAITLTRSVDGRELTFDVQLIDVRPNGELEFCIDSGGVRTLLGVKPSFHFFKAPNGAVRY